MSRVALLAFNLDVGRLFYGGDNWAEMTEWTGANRQGSH